jgi:sec-independent protein translocase protein TatA
MAFGLGGTEVLILLLAALFLFFGGKKLPELAKGLGRAMGEFQRGRTELERQISAGDSGEDGAAGAPAGRPAAAAKPGALAVELKGPGEDVQQESRIVKAARALGIETAGKTDEELKREIARIADGQGP